jgi:hypothetical protein
MKIILDKIDLEGQLERLKENYKKLKRKEMKGPLTYAEKIMINVYPDLIKDQENQIKNDGRYVDLNPR